MTQILRVKARWDGLPGGDGYSVLHFRDFGGPDAGGGGDAAALAQQAVQRTASFFETLTSLLPDSVGIQVESDVDVLEDTTGVLVDSVSVVEPSIKQGTASGGYSGVSGAVVNWRTGSIRNGRKIRGRTFLVPLAASAYEDDGTLTVGARGTISSAAATLANSGSTPDLGVYARPSVKGASDGQWAVVTGSNVPDMAAIMKSRRQ